MGDTDEYIEEIFDQGEEGKARKKKKFPLWAKIAIGIVVVLLAILIGAWYFLNDLLGLINRVDTEEVSYISRAEETFEDAGEGDPEDDTIPEEELEEVFSDVEISTMTDEAVTNILLIGQDARSGETRARSDTMIIMSINTDTNSITLISLMRDMYVQIPGYSDNRINAAYAFGGMTLLNQTIEQNFGVVIDGNVEVNFEGFISAFTQIGNIQIELYQAEADYLNAQNSGWSLTAGVNSLTPEQALAYSRIRYVGNADYERTERQRRVLMAAFNVLSSQGVLQVVETATNIFPYLTTDLTNQEILSYVYTIFSSGMSIGNTYRIPVDGTYSSEVVRSGMQVLVPDLTANSAYLKQYIYGTS